MFDPVTLIILVSAIVAAAAVWTWVVNRRRKTIEAARRRAWIQKQRERDHIEHDEVERLARRIIATSSTSSIAGFTIERQIEAVLTDGHPTPAAAVEALKAHAARLGANAVVNLEGQRQGTGKCIARGDAVIARPIQAISSQGHADSAEMKQSTIGEQEARD